MSVSKRAATATVLVASMVLAAGCAKVPDFMVEGRLPNFGDKPVKVAAQPASPAQAPAVASTPKAAAKPAPASAPSAVQSSVGQSSAGQSSAAKAPVTAPAPSTAASMIVNAHGRDEANASAPAQPAPPVVAAAPAPPPKPSKKEVMPPLAGGFSPATDKAAIERVADFAVHESPGYVLKSVKSAQVQVVAGLNYDLCLKVRTPGHEASWVRQRYVKARVYQALDQHLELTSWNEVERCD